MNFLITTIRVKNNSLAESAMNEKVVKELAYGSKIKEKTEISFNFVLIPVLEGITSSGLFNKKITSSLILQDNEIASIESIFSSNITAGDVISIDPFLRVTENDLDIFYSDGSFDKKTNRSSFAVCKLLQEDKSGVFDLFSEKQVLFESYSGIIDDSTNNIGELNGIRKTAELFGDKKIELIISDSEYSIKCFREWFYNWKNNGFKTYSKKPIANENLIKETFEKLTDSGKIILFKWTKGHNNDNFNEICDMNAKKILGIESKIKKII